MRRVLFVVVLAGLFAVHPVIAQDAKRQVRSVPATQQAKGVLGAAPDATRLDPSLRSPEKASRDPRPLRGLDSSRIPRYPSIEAFLAKHGPAELRAQATVVGKAALVRQPVSRRLANVSSGAAGARSGLSMGARLRLERAPNGTVRWLRGRLGRAPVPAGGAGKQAAYTQAALAVADAYAGVLRLDDPATELRPIQTTRDDLGYVHARFEQTYRGLPVWGRDLYVHLNAEGEVYAVNGTYEPTPVGLATTPALDEATALQAVVGDLEARGRWAPVPDDVAAWLDVEAPTMDLVVYPDPEQGMRLAYAVSLHPNLLEWYTYLVDARTGQILDRIARHCTLHHHPAAAPPLRVSLTLPDPSATPARGEFFDASATDLNGATQDLRVYQHDDGIFYNVWDLDNLNPASNLPNEPEGGALTIDANSTDFDENVNLTHVTSNDNTWNDPASVSAHVNMNIVYDYYKNTHNRNAIDGNDQAMISVIHVTDEGRPMDNAFWNGRLMAYGDGDQAFLPLAGALDVAAHEVTHGVIENTAGLVYQFQPGALNESFADVFGVLVEPNDFLVGEDIMRANAAALRDLLNPDNPNVLSQQPAHMRDFVNLNADQDNGGVHVNSGIPNRAAALIIQILGIQPTEQIYYRALTTYLTRNSQFGDARNALEQAAIDLFGDGSNAVTAVQQSFDDVGILATTGMDNNEGNDLPPQTGGTSLIAFMLEDGTIGLIDMTDPENPTVGTFNDPAAVARVDAEGFDRSQLTTPLNGETIYFVNPDNKLAVLQVESGLVDVFDDLFIQEEGDLWNASISPNEDFVALVSAYENDPTLYIFDGEQLGAIDLKPETTQQGVQNETIQFPDVVSWSPNPQLPRIVFDALNRVDFVGESAIQYWSIYEIDFAAQTILNLIPAQPDDVSVGNITYSNTDPDRVAFNLIDDTNTWDVLIGDFATGDTEPLGLPNFTIDNVPLTDAERPTFSPDDTQLAFTSATFGAMFFYDRETGMLTGRDFGAPMFNPRWFVRGGSGGSSNQAPTAGFTASTTSGPAPLLVSFDASLSSDPDGDPLTYRWDFGDGSTGSGRTTSHTFAATGAVPVTLTVLDSGGLSDTATLQVEVEAPGADVITLRNFDPQSGQIVWFLNTVAPDSGFVFGTNWFGDQAKASAFFLPMGVSEAQVTEVNVWFAYKRDGLTNQTYALEILDGTLAAGPAATPLFSQSFPLADVNADADAMTAEPPTNHGIAPAVSVGSPFYVSVDFGSYGEADWGNAALVATDLVGHSVPEVWEKWADGSWNNLSGAWDFGSGFDMDGAHLWIEVVASTDMGTPVEEAGEVPRTLALSSTYPNPFRSATTVRFELPTRTDIDLRVVDLLGRTVAMLVEGPMEAGVHTVRFEAGSLPSGVYLARLRAGSATQTRKLVLLK